jgi:hypothetical protein
MGEGVSDICKTVKDYDVYLILASLLPTAGGMALHGLWGVVVHGECTFRPILMSLLAPLLANENACAPSM